MENLRIYEMMSRCCKVEADEDVVSPIHTKKFTDRDINITQMTSYLCTRFVSKDMYDKDTMAVLSILRDCLLVNTHRLWQPNLEDQNISTKCLYEKQVLTQLNSEPVVAFLNTSFNKIISQLLSHLKHPREIGHHLKFIDQLADAFESVPVEHIERFGEVGHNVTFLPLKTTLNFGKDGAFLLNFSLTETTKWLVASKFEGRVGSSTVFGKIVDKMENLWVDSDKTSRKYLAYFNQIFDKYLQDHVEYSSTGEHTFVDCTRVANFFVTNDIMIKDWLAKHRRDFAILSLISDDPADCWRQFCIKLTTEMSTTPDSTPERVFSPEPDRFYVERSIPSLGDIGFLVQSAKQLRDLNLLVGIKKYRLENGAPIRYSPLDPIISNVRGQYEKTIELYNLYEDPAGLDPVEQVRRDYGTPLMDDLSTLEILEAYRELGMIVEHSYIAKALRSRGLKKYYLRYLESFKQVRMGETKIKEIILWTKSWDTPSHMDLNEPVPSGTYFDLVMSTLLNYVSQSKFQVFSDPGELIKTTEWALGLELVSQNMFAPSYLSPNIQIYTWVLEILKTVPDVLPSEVINMHKKDYRWCSILYRVMNEAELVWRYEYDDVMDLVAMNAAKFHLRCGNNNYGAKILERFDKPHKLELKATSLMAAVCSEHVPQEEKYERIKEAARMVVESELADEAKDRVVLKCFRRMLKVIPYDDANDVRVRRVMDVRKFVGYPESRQVTSGWVEGWRLHFLRSDLVEQAKTQLMSLKRINYRFHRYNQHQVLNAAFGMALELLPTLCQLRSSRWQCHRIETAMGLLRKITRTGHRIYNCHFTKFSDKDWIMSTERVWVALKTTLISMVTFQGETYNRWQNALVTILKTVAESDYQLLLYDCIVNRIDLRHEMLTLDPEVNADVISLSDLWSPSTPRLTAEDIELKKGICIKRLNFWNQIFNHMRVIGGDEHVKAFPRIALETEIFVREMRKISVTAGDYCKSIANSLTKRLQSFLEWFTMHAKPRQITDYNELRNAHALITDICNSGFAALRLLEQFKDTEAASAPINQWFFHSYTTHLREVEVRLEMLLYRRPLDISVVRESVKTIIHLFGHIRAGIAQYYQNAKNVLMLEVASPMLSRMGDLMVPLPECSDLADDTPYYLQDNTTLHRVGHRISLLTSKTGPKKLKLIGSDGGTRYYILKSQEDLRLDQTLMGFFATLNKMLMGNNKTVNRYAIRRYAVTPMSSRVGLIKFVNAVSLGQAQRNWLHSPNGRKATEELYADTCPNVCAYPTDQNNYDCAYLRRPRPHQECEVPLDYGSTTLFYQLLWAKTRPTLRPITRHRPQASNSSLYRAQFDPQVFMDIVDELRDMIPSDLLANELWFNSCNAHSYWLRTKQFTNSYATFCMVGYIIGLGDRHAENILLDVHTGEVIHVDYNLAFEGAKKLSCPENMPFRLTPNVIRAFGFAGLEGEFTKSCRDVLAVLRDQRLLIEILLDPISFGFMMDPLGTSSAPGSGFRPLDPLDDLSDPRAAMERLYDLMTLGELGEEQLLQEGEFMCLDPDIISVHVTKSHGLMIQVKADEPRLYTKARPTCELQYNIEPPAILDAEYAEKAHKRIRQKLMGSDKLILIEPENEVTKEQMYQLHQIQLRHDHFLRRLNDKRFGSKHQRRVHNQRLLQLRHQELTRQGVHAHSHPTLNLPQSRDLGYQEQEHVHHHRHKHQHRLEPVEREQDQGEQEQGEQQVEEPEGPAEVYEDEQADVELSLQQDMQSGEQSPEPATAQHGHYGHHPDCPLGQIHGGEHEHQHEGEHQQLPPGLEDHEVLELAEKYRVCRHKRRSEESIKRRKEIKEKIKSRTYPQSVEQQVDDLITAATSPVNKGSIFEGWTPWF